jgi:release factor glutamine methyltransferase
VTSGAALASAARLLGTRLDAELLLAHVLDADRASVVARDDRVLTPEEQGDFENLVARRLAGEPLAYLTGTKEFWSLELEVTPAVLVPRPETELLVEWGLELLSVLAVPEDEVSILDLGTGSGAIALAIAKERPHLRVVATDVSAAALEVARGNARRLGLGNVEFRRGDLFAPLGPDDHGQFDLILSNPPYIALGDPHLADLKFEPALALSSGADGLDALRAIVAGAQVFLKPDGWLVLEHGSQQAAALHELMDDEAYVDIVTRRDLAGLERATSGMRPS